MFQDWEHLSNVKRQGTRQECFNIGNVLTLGTAQQCNKTWCISAVC